jgi:hypothetical protein
MNLEGIRSEAVVFIDTNILIYAGPGLSKQCRQLLDRIDETISFCSPKKSPFQLLLTAT